MKYKFLLVIFTITFFLRIPAQTYNFKLFNEENGLNQSYIYSISQSVEGLLIMSTGESLCLFDGQVFNNISNKQMVDNIILTHCVDSRNITWLGQQQNGLAYIKNEEYHNFSHKLFADIKINQVIEDKDHLVWVATSGGLFTIDSLFHVAIIDTRQYKIFNSLCFDDRNSLVAGTDKGIIILKENAKEGFDISEVSGFKDKSVKQIIRSSGSNYWVLVDGEGVIGLNYTSESYKRSVQIYDELQPGNFNITYIFCDKFKNLWVSVFGDGLRKLSFKGDPMLGNFSVVKIDKNNGLKSQNIQSIFQDSESNMWFGTFGDGLIKKPAEMFSFYGAKEGLSETDVKKVVVDSSGNLWMGTDKGLAVFKKQNNTYLLFNSTNGFIDDNVNTLLLDQNNILWIGTNQNGIFTYDQQTKKFVNFSKEKKIKHFSINTIIQTKDKIITGSTDGLYVYDKASGGGYELSTNDGLLHNNVVHLFEDSKRRLWIASHGTPPYYIASGKVTSFKKVNGLNSYDINSMCEDKYGNIWISSEGDGVFKYDNTRFRNYLTSHGLLSNYCNGIAIDRNNSVWVSHRTGLSELKDHHIKFATFSNQTGLLFCENNLNAIHKDLDTNLWFGTSSGVMHYDPESGKIGNKVPEIFITKISLNNSVYGPTDVIVKKYGYYIVHIDYHSISLSDPDAIYYKYKLIDVDSNWKITKTPFVDFPKLGDGNYKFLVIACNANTGLSSSVPATIYFTINQPIWKSSWFYVVLGFLLIAVFYIIVLIRIRSLKKTQAFLQFKIDEKTFLLQKEKEAVEVIKVELEHKNKDITASINYAKNIQDSLLPPDELLKELFRENYFVLYKPKDIVSGDFYWCTKHKISDFVTLHLSAVIDCTGHGVPGAFLSILANDFLKQSVTERNVNTPNEILDFLNENMMSHLNLSSSKLKLNDGMDISIVGIDYENKKLYYSGANNPIYIYRKNKNNKPIEIIIKATKQAIGSSNEKIVNYDLRLVDLLEGDTIYLFSDGYADQFGGPGNKKITYKSFRAILSKAYELSMPEQKCFIEQKLEEWKNGIEQTDDICIMGIRI